MSFLLASKAMRHVPRFRADHYCIPPLERIDLDAVLGLIRDKKYFVLHAPRQTGKTASAAPSDRREHAGSTKRYRWIDREWSAVLQVPSAMFRGETNFIVNPRHADFDAITTGPISRFRYDPRLAQ